METETGKGQVFNTYADARGIWHAQVGAAQGNGDQEVFGASWGTVRRRAAKAIEAEIAARQSTPCPTVKVDYLGMFRRDSDGSFSALFREK